MADADERGAIIAGMDVVGTDEGKIGQVNSIQGDYIVVSKGRFFLTDYYVPRDVVATVSDKVHLNVSRNDALDQGWDARPADFLTANAGDEDEPRTTDVTTPLTVSLHEEELHASTRGIERGRAKVQTVVTDHEQAFDLPVNEDHVLVRRETVTREVEPGEVVFTERTFDVPLRGEEVVIDKTVQVVEELEIDTQVVERTEHVTATARREEVQVYDEDGNLVAGSDVKPGKSGQ